jgi:kinesin family protein 1
VLFRADTVREGANINKSLSELGNVITKLAEASKSGPQRDGQKKIFIPYRNSKLTRVLQNSLGGNSLCSMLATVSPSFINCEESLTTLRCVCASVTSLILLDGLER